MEIKQVSRATRYRQKSKKISKVLKDGFVFIDTLRVTQWRLNDEAKTRAALQVYKEINFDGGKRLYEVDNGVIIGYRPRPRVNEPSLSIEYQLPASSFLLIDGFLSLRRFLDELGMDAPTLTRLDVHCAFPATKKIRLSNFDGCKYRCKHIFEQGDGKGEPGSVYFGGGSGSIRTNYKIVRIYDKTACVEAKKDKQEAWLEAVRGKDWGSRRIYSIEVETHWKYLIKKIGREWHRHLDDANDGRYLGKLIIDLFERELTGIAYKQCFLKAPKTTRAVLINDSRTTSRQKAVCYLAKAFCSAYRRCGCDDVEYNKIVQEAINACGAPFPMTPEAPCMETFPGSSPPDDSAPSVAHGAA